MTALVRLSIKSEDIAVPPQSAASTLSYERLFALALPSRAQKEYKGAVGKSGGGRHSVEETMTISLCVSQCCNPFVKLKEAI